MKRILLLLMAVLMVSMASAQGRTNVTTYGAFELRYNDDGSTRSSEQITDDVTTFSMNDISMIVFSGGDRMYYDINRWYKGKVGEYDALYIETEGEGNHVTFILTDAAMYMQNPENSDVLLCFPRPDGLKYNDHN